ncbi:MAG: DUF1553 domain-containing protein [Bacteroidetes bacterium]|nr:DUF1553 domain-containing protein [Bacteroidota bacterium]MCY4204670.1 DUF1553 domain-containing protein [Bacteroidota bacterium]
MIRFSWLLILLLLAACSQSSSDLSGLPATVDYNWHVKPVLSDRCYKCHGPDDQTRKAGLRLDVQENAYGRSRDDSSRQIILPGNANASVLVEHISTQDPKRRMPPPESNLSLSEQEITLIRRWIDQGAPWKPHWAFIPPVKAKPPEVRNEDWVRDPIDSFVLHKIESIGLASSNEAHPAKLLRRVTFDLTGLPPSPEELDGFLGDSRPGAYERVVDELLERPAFGERMASMWLDISRYADTHGYQDDRPRTMWPWRDWVVRAFNDNLPYDEFVIWQIAGDLLPDPTFDQRLATGFNRNHAITQEGGVVAEEYLTEYVADRTNTTATAFLGLTMECARCHDHKYDPILQEEYYSMFAFFNGIDEQAQISYFDLAPKPSIPLEDPELAASIRQTESDIDSLEQLIRSWPRISPPSGWLSDPAVTIDSGLLSFLPMDTLYGLRTPALKGMDGNINTGLEKVLAPPAIMSGKRGGAILFDGENFLDLGAEADFEWYDRFSLSTWVYAREQEKDVALLSKRNGEQKRGGYDLIRTTGGKLGFRLIHDGEHQIFVQSLRSIPANTWIHVSATYDGSGRADGIHLYVDGSLVRTQVLEDTLERESILNGNGLLAGHWTPRNRTIDEIEGMKGAALDELYVHARALTDVEVAFLADQSTLPEGIIHYRVHHDRDFFAANLALDSLRRSLKRIPDVMIMEEMATPRMTYILDRGAYDAPMDSVGPSTPAAVLSFPEDFPRNRLGLAKWITHEKNPLTARVAVNRFWQLLFGEGLVQTPEDFGNQGALPSHPELLDYLAVTFMESGYDMKALIKQIVMSATYRQSSHRTQIHQLHDPDNLLLARAPRKRLSAEMMRDNALSVSGLLNPLVGGEPVRPYQPAGLWKALANQIGENRYRPGPDVHRRSLYTYWKRTIPPPSMLTFDAPDRSVCTVERQSTATPLQSLVLLNDPQYVEAARALAFQIQVGRTGDEREQIEEAFRRLTSRLPEATELNALMDLYAEQMVAFQGDPVGAHALISVGVSPIWSDVDPVQLAAMTVVTSTIINLDEAQYR